MRARADQSRERRLLTSRKPDSVHNETLCWFSPVIAILKEDAEYTIGDARPTQRQHRALRVLAMTLQSGARGTQTRSLGPKMSGFLDVVSTGV